MTASHASRDRTPMIAIIGGGPAGLMAAEILSAAGLSVTVYERMPTPGRKLLIAWAEGLGQQTFIGSSGRVFPKALKASPLLRAWLARLSAQGVSLRTRHEWLGWDEAGKLIFRGANGSTDTIRA